MLRNFCRFVAKQRISVVFLSCQFRGVPNLEFFSSPTFPFTSPFPPNHMHQPYCQAPRCWKLITTHTLPCINPVLWLPAFFFGLLALEDGTDRLSRNVFFRLNQQSEYKVFSIGPPANWTHNPHLHTIPTTWKPKHQIPQTATFCIILSSCLWWA